MTISWPFSRQQVLDANGHPYLDLRANFFVGGTSTPLTVYSDAGLTVPRTQPVIADANGRFPRVYLPAGLYREQVLGPGGVELWFDDGLGEAVDATTPTDPTTPPDASSYATTGDVKWRLDGAILPGWVRMNGGTLGNAASGATERANADAKPAFAYLWTSFRDAIAPVSGGRGLSADADFAAGKTISVPSMRGMVATGLDDMGASPAQVLQTIRSITLTSGSQTAAIASTDRLSLYMVVIAPGLPPNTRIAAIAAGQITLSQAATNDGTVTARFASVLDAQDPGSTGGDALVGIGNQNLPVTLPSVSVPYDDPPRTTKTYATLAQLRIGDGGTAVTVTGIWQNTQDQTTDLDPVTLTGTQANANGGVPLGTVQPLRLGTYYMKL